MRLDPAEARRRLGAAEVARLATVSADGRPHVVPICFALAGECVYSAVDDKPKSTSALQRIANIAANGRAAVLVDHYDDDWAQLWWVRADGVARVIEAEADAATEAADAIARLRAKYPQYRDHRLHGAVLAIDVTAWTGWAASAPGASLRG